MKPARRSSRDTATGPTLAQLLSQERAGYWERRALTAPYEWTYTLAALAASAWAVLAFLTLRPNHTDDSRAPGNAP